MTIPHRNFIQNGSKNDSKIEVSMIYYKKIKEHSTMTNEHFKDLLFQLFNENDTFIQDIDLDDSNNYFLITCIDGSRFSLSVQEPLTFLTSEPDLITELTQDRFDSYITTHTKSDYLSELEWLVKNNPYVFQILLVVLKLSELNIISESMAQDIMSRLQPYAQELKKEWDSFHKA